MASIDDVKAAQAKEATDLATVLTDLNAAVSAATAAWQAAKAEIAALQAAGAPNLQPLVDAATANDAAINNVDTAIKAAVANIQPPPPAA